MIANREENRQLDVQRLRDAGVPVWVTVIESLDEALARTTAQVFAVVAATAEAGERELRIVQAQDAFAHPRMQFEARQVR